MALLLSRRCPLSVRATGQPSNNKSTTHTPSRRSPLLVGQQPRLAATSLTAPEPTLARSPSPATVQPKPPKTGELRNRERLERSLALPPAQRSLDGEDNLETGLYQEPAEADKGEVGQARGAHLPCCWRCRCVWRCMAMPCLHAGPATWPRAPAQQ